MHRRLRWPDSLFTRLLLVQGLVVASAVLIFGLMLTMERNTLLARPYIALWAEPMGRLVRMPVGAPPVPVFDLPLGLRRESGPPEGGGFLITRAPAARAARTELALHGLQLEAVWLTPHWEGVTLWMGVRPAGGELAWVSASGLSALPSWSFRLSLGTALLLLLIAAISRYFVRRVTQPLAQLHQRMQGHARTGVASPPTVVRAAKLPPELRAMDQAYTQLAERLARNERERALLLAGVSHDLRSPLARIRLAAEMLPETADNAGGVAAVTRNVDQADRLIASFLEFVRAGTQPMEEAVEASAVVRQAVAGFNRPAAELCVRAPDVLVLQRANTLLLDRLVVNLVDNALKHGGTPVFVELFGDGEHLQLNVADAGPGLPAGGAERLLEAFARGDTSRGVPGFGLGLAIVHQIVTRLEGRLAFHHSPAAGHQVQVRLPLTR